MSDLIRETFVNTEKEENLSKQLLTWFSKEKRDLPWRKTKDPYAIWISEVMLQQTQVKTVIPYYERFLERFPDVKRLAAASLDEVLTVWSGLGYYSRARRMWQGANYILQRFDGVFPRSYRELLQIPGVGDYTGGAIASIAFGEKEAAIDGNVKRVVSRILAWAEPVETVVSYRRIKEWIMMWQPPLHSGDFNQALMELGALVCTPTKPACQDCPLSKACKGYLQGDCLRYPVKKSKARPQVVTRLTFVLRKGDKLYIQKRPSKGLLADLREFPGVELGQGSVHSLDKELPSIEGEEAFELFRQAVPKEVVNNGWVEEQFRRGLVWQGPIWYTFSHRRWKILWTIIDLPGKTIPQNEPNQAGELKPPMGCNLSLKESTVGYQRTDDKDEEEINREEWVSIDELKAFPLPVAFSGIVDKLCSIQSH